MEEIALNTIGDIATHLIENFPNIPAGVSGNLIEIVNMARVEVENFTGQTIGSNSIDDKYQSSIVNLAKADLIDQTYMYAGQYAVSGTQTAITTGAQSVSLEGLRIDEGTGGATVSAIQALGGLNKSAAQQFREMAERSMKLIGRKIRFGKTMV